MLSAIMLLVIVLNVANNPYMLSAQCRYAECHYAECRYADCREAPIRPHQELSSPFFILFLTF